MLQLEWPLVLTLLPLPGLIYWLSPTRDLRQQAALRVPFIDDFRVADGVAKPRGRRDWRLWLGLLAWLLLVLAASRPQWLGESILIPVSGRDLMLAVDLSDSMRTDDFVIDDKRVNRWQATRRVASEFIDRRRGDRLGLILFGTQAYLQTPLTFDTETVKSLLREASIGIAGDRTAIGDAIGLAVKRMDPKTDHSKVLVLITDGTNTAGEVAPLKAAELAASRGIRIYTIGIGADEQVEITWFGLKRRNRSAQLDEKSLRAIAQAADGRYFRARDSEELSRIYNMIDQLEPMPRDTQSLAPVKALFMWPLTLALALSGLMLLDRLWRRA